MKVLVVGLGWIAHRVHIPALVGHPKVESVLASDIDWNLVREVSHEFGVLPYGGTLEDSEADLVVVCTPPETHAGMALRALGAGKDVLLEKPMAMNGKDAARIASMAKQSGLRLGVCYTNQLRSDVTSLIQLVLNGDLGDLISIRCSWLRRKGVPATTGARSAGVLWDLGPHLSDILVGLAPDLGMVTVSGHPYTEEVCDDSVSDWYQHTGVTPATESLPGSTGVRAVVVSDFGPVMQMDVAWARDVPHDLTSFDVVGTKATAHLRSVFGFSPDRQLVTGPALTVVDSSTGTVTPIISNQERNHKEYFEQLETFLDSSLDTLWLKLDRGVRSTLLLEAIARSVSDRKPWHTQLHSKGDY